MAASVGNRAPRHGGGVRCPVSSRCLVILAEEVLQGSVFVGVVGGVVLPAVPDDEEPGAGEDADRVRVVVAAGAGALLEVGGPGVGVAAVAGEVADGVAELFVAGPAETDATAFAGLSGGRSHPGQAGQRVGGGKAAAAVADLGQQPGGADRAAAGQAGEDLLVSVLVKLLADLYGQRFDLLGQRGQQRHERSGDVGLGGAVLAGGAARG